MSTVTPIGGSLPSSAAAPGATDTAAAAVSAPVEPVAKDPYTNPQIQVDPASGAVILEYRDSGGKLLRQVPSEYELRSYQVGQVGPQPRKAEPG
ncbi:MAG: hypothetical protein JO267_12540 [Alphaproteobacteria bacterium]|nr:hypothetical protein [Alphaproteobacteria bacterium]